MNISQEYTESMISIETIVSELHSVPESMLAEILSFVRATKNQTMRSSENLGFQRIAGLHEGQIWISDDFNDPLPDEFWLGDDN